MAVVSPFAALRYDPRKVDGLENVLTQPYDKITPEMQQEYLERSPFNLAHIIKGEVQPGDSATDNVYTRAAACFRDWIARGVLARRDRPAFYAYFQEFRPPEDPSGPLLVRRGFLGLGKLESYDSDVVFRHEQTLSAPKADRLELLRATRTHFEPIFLLYSDPKKQIEQVLNERASQPPVVEVQDEYGVIHRVWDVEDPQQIRTIQEHMREKKLIIADGHHRYETALNFWRECVAARPHAGDSDCAYAIMALVNMDSAGVVILPTHRVVSGVAGFTRENFLAKAGRYFQSQEYPFSPSEGPQVSSQKLRAEMTAAARRGATAIGILFQGCHAFYLLQLRAETERAHLLPELLPAERSLDVTVLHRIAFALCLGMDEESVRKEKFLTYVRGFEEGMENILRGKAQACFFLNPVRIEQVRAIALAGRLLPQKSTDFYPKLLSGLVIYPLEG
ncbi:MAG: DUF1015 domain-containing protein [Acidobacteria bacterium]|nr:DUF1015 domain-containing protein [Acidobacteriota bacterium]